MKSIRSSIKTWWRALFVDAQSVPAPRRFRLIILVSRLMSEAVGGAELQAQQMADIMSADYDVVLMARTSGNQTGAECRGTYWLVRRPTLPIPGARALVDAGICFCQLWTLRPLTEAVIGYQTILNGFLAAVGGWLLGSRGIVFIRAEKEYQDDLNSLPTRFVSWLTWTSAHRILLQSAGMLNAFLDSSTRIGARPHAFRRKIGMVSNGIELPARTARGEGLVFVGRLHPMKGLSVLLAAIRNPDGTGLAPLTIVGDGALLTTLRSQADRMAVEFTGELSHDEVIDRLCGSSIFVFPATGGDGMPNAVMEAMAVGLPVIASRVGAISDLVSDGQDGILVPPGDATALRSAIQSLLGDRMLRERLGTNARRTASALSWERTREQMLEQLRGETASKAGAHSSRSRDVGYIGWRNLTATDRRKRHNSQIEGDGSSTRLPSVLLLGPQPDAQGGVATHISTLLASPLCNQFSLIFFQVGSSGRSKWIGGNLWRVSTNPLRLALVIIRDRPRMAHLNPSFDPKAYYRDMILLVMCRMLGVPVLLQFHGGLPHRVFGRLGVLTKLAAWPMLTANQIIVLTREQRDQLADFVPSVSSALLPNMVDIRRFTAANHGAPQTVRIVFLARFIRAKGIHDLIDAVPLVMRAVPYAEFHLAGDGSEMDSVRSACAARGVLQRVFFHGYISGERKVQLLASSQIFVIPSHGEGLPYALLEAMGSALPVVACPVGAIPDLIEDGENGYLVPTSSPGELASAIIRLAVDPELRQVMGTRNRAKIEANYDVAVVTQLLADLYARLTVPMDKSS